MTNPSDTLRARRVQIAEMIETLRAEDQELEIAEQVLARMDAGSIRAPAKQGGARLMAPRMSAIGDAPKSQRELVLDALAASSIPWIRARDIISLAKSRWGVTIPEKSLRPLLSVLKNNRRIVRHGRVVALRERAGDTQTAKTTTRRRG